MMHLSGEPDRHAEISSCAGAASWYPDPLEPQPPDLQGIMCVVPAVSALLLISSISEFSSLAKGFSEVAFHYKAWPLKKTEETTSSKLK